MLLAVLVLTALTFYFLPADPCNDDSYALDRDSMTQQMRDRCENSGQGAAPPFMINRKADQ